MTKADKIRQMSNEELIEWLIESNDCCYCIYSGFDCSDNMCRDGIRKYLEAEVSE